MAPITRRILDWLHTRSIRTRLVLYVLLGLLPMLLATVYFTRETYIARERQVLLGHMAAAQATAGAVEEFIVGIVRAQDIMSITIARDHMTAQQMNSFFAEAQREIPVLDTLGFALPSGQIVAGAPPTLVGRSLANREYFRKVADGEDWAVSNLLERIPTGELALIIAQRVAERDRFEGVLFSAIAPSTLQQFVEQRASPNVGYGILDAGGQVIVTTILPAGHVTASRDRSQIPSVQEALHGDPAFATPFRDPADGVMRMGASVPVPEVGWVVNVLEPVSTAMAPVRRAAALDLLADVLIIALMLGIAWAIGANISKPITQLSFAAEAVGRGDFSQRVETQDRAEFGALADSFNSMASDLDLARQEGRIARERAQFLADVGELLVSTLDPDEMLAAVTEKSVQFLGDIVVIYKLEADGLLRPVSIHAYDDSIARLAWRVLTEDPIHVGEAVVGAAVKNDETVFVSEVSELPDETMRRYLDKAHAISSVAVPMKVHGQTVGALSISTTRQHMSEDLVPTVQELARRVGLALENASLYADTLEREEFQKGIAELAAAVGSSLDPSVVLSEVCRQTMRLLDADGVYIWMLEEDGSSLFGASACGFKAGEFTGMRLPMTESKTGAVQAMRRKQGFFLHEMPSWRDVGPMLTEKFSVQSAIFEPLISGGEALGTMVITDTQDTHRFDDPTLARAGLLAGYAATSIANASSYQRERRIAETLQRGLLPAIPDTIPGFEMAHFYTPAWQEAAIGGDFYDFTDVGGGVYALTIGDVSGKGLEAAVVTAMVKYLLRAYTAEDAEPSVVLERTNNAIIRYTEPDLFITLIYGLLSTKTRRFRYGSAGHEPILVYRAGDSSLAYENPEGTAAGLIQDEEYLTHESVLDPGDIMVMYTDGLTDARSPDGAFLGQEGLARIVSLIGGRPANEFLEALIAHLKEFTGGEFGDDIAVLVVRATP